MMKTFGVSFMTAVFTIFTVMPAGWADAYHPDPYGYYSKYDKSGYYDKNGNYIHFSVRPASGDKDWDDDDDATPPPPPPGRVYSDVEYVDQCQKERASSNTAGTIIGALAGGLLGGAMSHHGNGGAVVGGVLLGGLVGNALTRNVPCDDHPYMIRTYSEGLDGPIGRRYDWRHGNDYGYFVPSRQFQRDGYTCRSFRETTYVAGKSYTRTGSACRVNGNWRFDD